MTFLSISFHAGSFAAAAAFVFPPLLLIEGDLVPCLSFRFFWGEPFGFPFAFKNRLALMYLRRQLGSCYEAKALCCSMGPRGLDL